MSKRIYVGNLSFRTTENDVTTAFAGYGSVESVNIITDRETGRSKGFGFVEMAAQADADKAITALNGTELDGRALTVNEAKPMLKNDNAGFRRGGRDRY
jgi:cold-inducible RNA-binding protein